MHSLKNRNRGRRARADLPQLVRVCHLPARHTKSQPQFESTVASDERFYLLFHGSVTPEFVLLLPLAGIVSGLINSRTHP